MSTPCLGIATAISATGLAESEALLYCFENSSVPGGLVTRKPQNPVGRQAASPPAARTLDDLDELDRSILRCLQQDGRTSNASMARALGVSEPTIRNRISRLTAGGLVKVTAVVNPLTSGFACDVIIGLTCEPGSPLEVAHQLSRFEQMMYLGHTTGRYDMLIEMLFRNDAELFSFLTKDLPQINGITSTEIMHVIRAERVDFDWRPGAVEDPNRAEGPEQ
jgi:Lrp/AsnC family transcriptional regulator for asnA, asnC and gidA